MSTRTWRLISWAVTVTRDTALWGFGVWMIWYEVRHGQPGHLRLEVLLLGAGLATSPAGLAAWAARHGVGISSSPSSPPPPSSGPSLESAPSTSGEV